MPKCYREAATLMSRRHKNVRQQGKTLVDVCPSVFFSRSVGSSAYLVCAFLPESQCLGLSKPWHRSYLLSPFLWVSVPDSSRWSWEDSRKKKKTYHRTPLTSTKSQKVFSCVIQPKLWEVKPAAIINILTHDVSSLFHQYPSCVLVFLTWNSGTTWGPISISPD